MTTTLTPDLHDVASTTYSGHRNLEAMERMTRYNGWIFSMIAPHLGPSVLEAGCGTGNITRLLLTHPGLRRYVGVDLSPQFCDHLKASLKAPAGATLQFQPLDLENPDLLKLAPPAFDSIVCLNVLEHIRNDADLLSRFERLLLPKGRLILQVPAFSWLYGTIDEVDGHERRYTRRTLVPLVQAAGFKVLRAHYFNVMGIPAWLWHGKIRKLRTHSQRELSLWDRAVPLLRRLEQWVPLPFGLSLIVIAERQ